jgi:hypothetical protein
VEGTVKARLKYLWETLVAIAYLAVVIGVLSIATTKFETVVLAVLVQLYAAVLWNFSVTATVIDANNYAGLVRFRILATAQGVMENADGTFEEQEKALADVLASGKITIIINRLSHTAVSLYAIFKIVQAIFF